MGNLKGVWSGVCRCIAESQRLLSSFVRPYARSPLPPPEEKCRSSPSIETYLRVRLDSKESTMTGGEDCESRSFVTVSVSGHSRGSEARNSKTTPRAAQQSSPPAKSTTPGRGWRYAPQRTAGLSRSDQGNKLGAPKFCQERFISSSLEGCTGIPKGVHNYERLLTGWRNA
jgi:hypothetical protein